MIPSAFFALWSMAAIAGLGSGLAVTRKRKPPRPTG